MSDAYDPPSGPLGNRPREELHESVVQRLKSHYGRDVDPDVNLQHPDEDDGLERPERSPDEDSATSLGLVRRLAAAGSEMRYEVKREIARGGMGTILRVWDDDLRRNLAMKVLHSKRRFAEDSTTAGLDREKLGRFLEEAQITGQLDHPGIVPVHDLGIDDDGRCYFTMRLVRGRELKDVLDDAREGRDGWTMTRALTLILKVCETMAFAHDKRVVHRDLKPSNIMVGRYGEVYVMDWGLARILGQPDSHDIRLRTPEDPSSLSLVRTVRKDESENDPESPLVTMDGDVVGTPSFMAVEQAQGRLEDVGPRSDVYSLGAILYYMLTGKAPYVEKGERLSPHTVLNRVLQGPPEPVSKIAQDQPPELVAICEKAMSRDARDRYASMKEVGEDVQAYLEDRVVSAYEGGSIAEFKKWVVRNRGVAAAVAGMVLLAILSTLVFALQKQRRVTELASQQEETRKAKERAEENAVAAGRSAKEAQDNLELARRRERESIENFDLAEEKRIEAERSSYLANITAADYSLRLDEVKEARDRLNDANVQSSWEYWYLRMKAWPALDTFDSGRLVDEVRWSADGEHVYVLTREGLKVLNVLTRAGLRKTRVQLPMVGATALGAITPLRMSFSPDESRVALVGVDSNVRIHDVESGELLETLPSRREVSGHGARAGSIAYSPDGRYLVTGADNGSILLWNPSGVIVRRFLFHSGAVTGLVWRPDSQRFASASSDGAVVVWDPESGQQDVQLLGHKGGVRAVCWDDTGSRLFSGGSEGIVNAWAVETGRLVASYAGHRASVRGLHFDPASGRLVSSSDDRTLRIWDLETGQAAVLLGHQNPVLDVVHDDTGQYLFSCAEDGQLKLWDARGDLATTDLVAHERPITQVAFRPDQAVVASADESGEVILWDAPTGLPLRKLRGHTASVVSLAYDVTGAHLFTASKDGTVRRWSGQTGAAEGIYQQDGPVEGLLVLDEGERFLVSTHDKKLRVYEAESGLLVNEFTGPRRAALKSLVALPDGEHFLGTVRGQVVPLRIDGQEPDESIKAMVDSSQVVSVAVTPDGENVFTALTRGEIVKWAFGGGALERVRDHSDAATAIAVHPSEPRVASGSNDETIRIRDVSSVESLLTIPWAGESVTCLAFSPDGSRLLSGSDRGSLRIWETGTRNLRRQKWLELSARRRGLQPLVERLFDENFTLREVRQALQSEPDLSSEERQTALRLAELRGDDPRLLYQQTLAEALVPGEDPQVYAHAFNRAEAASGMPVGRDIPAVMLSLGVAQFRVGLEDEALESLESARQLSEDYALLAAPLVAPLSAPEDCIRLLFLAMARHRLGQPNLAMDALEEALELYHNHPDLAAYRARLGEVLDEVEALVGTS